MTTLQTIQDFVKDKKVLLIGNGEHKNITLSDYDVVVRMNYGIQKGFADIWVNNLIQYQKGRWDWNKVEFTYMLRLNAENKGVKLLRGYPERYRDCTYFWNPGEYLEFSKDVGYTQPFTGTTTLHWICHNTAPKSITVIGMDFFKNGKHATTHQPDRDREYVARLFKEFNVLKL